MVWTWDVVFSLVIDSTENIDNRGLIGREKSKPCFTADAVDAELIVDINSVFDEISLKL